MDTKTKAAIEERIHQDIEEAKEQIKRLTDLVKPIAPDVAVGRLSRLEAISSKGVNEAALSQARQKLSSLQTSLANLGEPEFGICFECGEDIPVGRILLMPEAKMCVACAEENEQ